MAKTIIGVMGPGDGASETEIKSATELGKQIAGEGWVLLTGGRNVGVMEAASKGAQEAGGLTVDILPTEDQQQMSAYVDIPICTGMGSARNNINVLSSDVVIACGSGAGTSSEIMLAIKAGKPLVLLHPSDTLLALIDELSQPNPIVAKTPEQVIKHVKKLV